MGKVIMCTGRLAETPYTVPNTEIKLYSIEEICYYVGLNIYNIEPSFFTDELIKFIKTELALPSLSDKIRSLVVSKYGIKDLVTALLCSSDIYNKEEILAYIDILNSLSKMKSWEKKAYIGYKLLEEGRYVLALKNFRGSLREEKLSEKDYGRILKAVGICLVHTSDFKEAADCFYKSYLHCREREHLILTLLALRLGNLGREFEKKLNLPKEDMVVMEAEEIWKKATKKALESERVKRIDNIFTKLRTDRFNEGNKEIELSLEEFKKEYREETWNGLIS